jgi:hypothetical protein
MDAHQPSPDDSLDAIIAADSAARLAAARLLSLT